MNQNLTKREIETAQRLGEAFTDFIITYAEARMAQLVDIVGAAEAERREQEQARIDAERERLADTEERMFLTSKEAADMLAVSTRTLYAFSHPRGPIPVIKLGNSVRYDRRDIIAAMERLKSK